MNFSFLFRHTAHEDHWALGGWTRTPDTGQACSVLLGQRVGPRTARADTSRHPPLLPSRSHGDTLSFLGPGLLDASRVQGSLCSLP